MTRQIQIAVLGSSASICTKKAYQMAYEVGKELGSIGVVTLTGGGLGVMEAALKGAKETGGKTLAIVPWETPNMVNDYADIVVATGIGWSRNAINLNSCDGAIVVGGGAGTLNEATYAYMQDRPVVAIKTSGGIAKEIAGKYFDVRKSERILSANTAKDAVQKLILQVQQLRESPTKLSKLDQELLHSEEKEDWSRIIKKRRLEMARKNVD
ncbi:MAG: TIGR00725 family protein [Candidatus Woesearchaeota archaeon]